MSGSDSASSAMAAGEAGSAGGAIAERLGLGGRDLREHTARGTLINAGFNVGLAGIGLARNFLVAIFLTASEYGLWGVIINAVLVLLWFKEVGVSDKFIQQSEDDQELAFQKAFTINLAWTGVFSVVIVASMPLFAVLYGRPEIIAPGMALSLVVVGSALNAPAWIFYRQMRFAKQRALLAVDPVVSLIVTIALGIAGLGYWCLVIGAIVGTWSAGAVALKACPYPIRLRFDREAVREYFSFGWPLVLATGSRTFMVQAIVLSGETLVGLAGIGAIGLATTITRFADRVDQVITQTIYPAICAVRDRRDLLLESFTKSNRLALMWGMPFGFALALFAPDIVHYVLGDKWEIAIGLIQVIGVLAGVQQIAFNWTAFHRAVGETRPMAVNGICTLVVFLALGVPLMIAYGLEGYAIAMIAVTAVEISVRSYFLSKLFSGFAIVRHSLRAITPSVPAVLAVLGVRLLEGDMDRSLPLAIAELVLYLVVTAVATWFAERDLLREMFGYLRPGTRAPQAA